MSQKLTVTETLSTIKELQTWINENPSYIAGCVNRYAEIKYLRNCLENSGKIQNNCPYGYVLPDRCRYNSRTGCECGAYGPLTKS